MIDFNFKEYCYGCKNCENICPKGAIKLIENQEGFKNPVIDKKKCINCGLCDKVCPYLNRKNEKKMFDVQCYSCYLKNEEERLKSTSGAIFPKIAEYILNEGGIICGCIWNENMEAEHVLSDDQKKIELMRGSKYLQSDLKKCVNQIKKVINNRKVLFVGTPCQVAATKVFIGEHVNLYTCSLICEGVPSNKVWRKYKDKLEEKSGSKLKSVNFRCKEISWESPIVKYTFENNKEIKNMAFNYDRFVLGFLQGLYYRMSCINCKYKGDGNNADIIIGDFWGISKSILNKSNNKGVSAVIVNSLKGEEIFKKISNDYTYEESNYMKIIEKNPRLMSAMALNPNRKNFFENLDKVDIIKNINSNLHGDNKIRFLKQLAYKTGTFKILKKLKIEKED